MALQLMSSLVKHGEVRRGLLGVSVQDLTRELAAAFDLESRTGAVISRVQSDSPAEQAGLEPGDVILAINGRSVTNSAGVRNAIGLMQVGDQVELDVIHQGRKVSRTARIAKPEVVGVDGGHIHPTLAGTTLSVAAGSRIEGILFSEIAQSSYPWAVGLRPGDILVSANNFRIRTLDELQTVASQRRSLLIRIQRDDEAFIVHLQ
jgi:serine protease Do/serine protease DegQ